MPLPENQLPVTTGLTYEDYVMFPDDGRRHELVGGDHYVTPAPSIVHQRFLGNVYHVLKAYVLKQGQGELFFAPVDVVLSEKDVVQPDLVYVSAARQGIITAANIQGAPDLVMEVISESSRRLDRKVKRHLYSRYGVTEYWLADPELRIFEVYRPDAKGSLAKAAEYEDEGLLTSPIFPGLTLDLSRLW